MGSKPQFFGVEPSSGAPDRRSGAAWRLTANDAPDAEHAQHHASLFALCNGRLGVRAGMEEIGPGECFLSGVYDTMPIVYHERFTGFARTSDTRVPVADGSQMSVTLRDGEPLGQTEAFEHDLHLATGLSKRRTLWRSAAGTKLEITAERVLPHDNAAALAIRLTIASIDYDGPIAIASRLAGNCIAPAQGDDPRFGSGQGARLVSALYEAEGPSACLVQKTRSSEIAVACIQSHRVLEGALETKAFKGAQETCGTTFSGQLQPGKRIVIEKAVAWAYGPTGSQTALIAEAKRQVDQDLIVGFDGLATAAADTLAAFWDQAEIDIPRAPELAVALRYNLFQLRQNSPRDGMVGIAAKGVSGEGYEGHSFWDAEVFAAPVLTVTAPELARSHLLFRSRTLDRARAHARELNHAKGALYPWRTIAGDEASAYFPGGSAQYHINADIAFAVMVYDRASGDEDFIIRHGAEMVFETARIWLEIGAFAPRHDGAFSICCVTGPDEYTALIDNDYYTNRMAKAHLAYACELAARLKRDHAEDARALFARIELADRELTTWAAAAAAMRLPIDPVLGVHPQDDTFLAKPHWDFENSRDQHPLLLHYHPMTLYRHQVCKQASVVLAHALTANEDLAQKQRDFKYYEAVTVHDSTLSASSHAVLAADIGEMEKAAAFLRETSFVDLHNLHGNTDHGLHLAAAAGSWMALVWGWGGFRPQGEVPKFRPVRSAEVPSYAFRLVWRSRRLKVSVDGGGVIYTLLNGDPLEIDHDGARMILISGRPMAAPLASPRAANVALLVRRAPQHPIKAMLFDLDGVLTDTAHAHYRAWKQLADEIGVPFDEAANEALKGVDRMGSLDLILRLGNRSLGAEARQILAERKNANYQTLIADYGPGDLFNGAQQVLEDAKAAGLKLALVSASRNAPALLASLKIAHFFDHVVDVAALRRGKPDPEIYLSAAAALGIEPCFCAGVEDAQAGVSGLVAAEMYAVGVGDPALLSAADTVVAEIGALSLQRIFSL